MQNRLFRQFLLASACLCAATGWSQTQPATLPAPTVDATVTEWVIFVADPYASILNGRELAADTLPSFVDELRPANGDLAKANEPMPIGVIRLSAAGTQNKGATVDVSLGYDKAGGRTLATWPAATVRPSGIVWQDLKPADEKAVVTPLPDGAWIAPLRGNTPSWSLGSVAESFLLYDVTLPYPVSLKITDTGKGTFRVIQPMDAPMHDLTLYQQDSSGGWMSASLGTVAKTEGASMPKPAEKPQPTPAGRRVVVRAPASAPAPTSEPASTAPSAATQPRGTVATLSPATGGPAEVLAPWGKILADAGVPSGDQEVALKILARYALDPKRLTAVYRMDPAEFDKVLPLEVVPQPKKVSRVALVVVTGIDPRIEMEMDGWIAKLGSPSWKEREAAMEAIKKVGPAAHDRLEKATREKDIEVVYRAEQLLENLGNPTQ